MIIDAIATVTKNENLDKATAVAVMDEIMTGEATQAQIGSFLTALHMKGETIDEITAFAESMRKHCGEFTPDVAEEIDIVGTGGDCAGTFNISTVSSPLARVLSNLGVKRGMVVHGDDGLDEISAVTTTTICEFNNGTFETYSFNPEAYGFTLCAKEELTGGTPEENAQITKDILSGSIKDGKRTAVLLNAGAALHITNQISLEEGFRLAADTLDSGAALQKLEAFIAATNA